MSRFIVFSPLVVFFLLVSIVGCIPTPYDKNSNYSRKKDSKTERISTSCPRCENYVGSLRADLTLKGVECGNCNYKFIPWSKYYEEQKDKSTTVSYCAALDGAVRMFKVDVGNSPKRVADLIEKPASVKNWDGPYLDEDKVPIDSYGNTLELRDGRVFSAGPDGLWDTRDDISATSFVDRPVLGFATPSPF